MVKKTVDWYVADKGLVLFQGDPDAIFVSEAVKNFLSKNPLEKGNVVEVEVSKDEYGDDVVERVQKSNTKKEEKPKEKEKEQQKEKISNSDLENRAVTVACVSYKNNGISFEEDGTMEGDKFKAGSWYTVDIPTVKEKGIKRGVKVQITAEKVDGHKNNVIKTIDVVTEAPPKAEKTETVSTKNTYETNTNSVQLSIEAQASVNSANNTVAHLFQGKFSPTDANDGVLVKELVKVLAVHNFDMIQSLKNR